MNGLREPIFVVGCPRSGTTLVQCILSASAHAFSLPETHFFSYVQQQLGDDPTRLVSREDLARARAAVEAEADLPPLPAVWSALEARAEVHPLDVFLAIVEQFRPETDTSHALRAIEKTPRHVLHMVEIARHFPDARFVNVVRDPIDVASSLMGVSWAASRSVLSYAQRWTESIAAARAFSVTHAGRIQTVVYERLVRQPEAVTRDLCAFVGLPYEAAMLEEFGREAKRNVGRAETWKGDVGKGVLLNRQGVWRERMTPGQAWLVAHATRTLRRDFGYLQMPDATGRSVLSASAREIRVRFREARPSSGLVGAARHAGSVLKTLAPA